MKTRSVLRALNLLCVLAVAGVLARAQAPAAPAVPDWAQPGSATHQQVAPPADFHRPTTTDAHPIGIFDGQSDVGTAVVPGSAVFDAKTGAYTVRSAGYNIWYSRDEFHFLWKKMTGDLSLAADASFLSKNGYDDRKVVLVIRQSLEDNAAEAMVGEHGTGMIHLAERAATAAQMQDLEYRFSGLLQGVMAKRIGIEKHGDQIAIFVSLTGEPMHQLGPPITLHFDGPFYVGIGFCSHQPATVDGAVFTNVSLENTAGQVR
ncbi:MAG TPA: biopolymer transporter Tol [Terracidiphilus sp.]